jgi:hypothetical protein
VAAGALPHGQVHTREFLVVVAEVLADAFLAFFLVTPADDVAAAFFAAGPRVEGSAGGGIRNFFGPDDQLDRFEVVFRSVVSVS